MLPCRSTAAIAAEMPLSRTRAGSAGVLLFRKGCACSRTWIALGDDGRVEGCCVCALLTLKLGRKGNEVSACLVAVWGSARACQHWLFWARGRRWRRRVRERGRRDAPSPRSSQANKKPGRSLDRTPTPTQDHKHVDHPASTRLAQSQCWRPSAPARACCRRRRRRRLVSSPRSARSSRR